MRPTNKETNYARARRRAITWRLVVNSYPCEECHASPGRACITIGGNARTEPHAARSAAAHDRGWAFADSPARCVRCHGKLPGLNPDFPQRCPRCVRLETPRTDHATADNPGPDGSYDVPLFGDEP